MAAALVVLVMLLIPLFGTWPIPRNAGFLHGVLLGAVVALCLRAVHAAYRNKQGEGVSPPSPPPLAGGRDGGTVPLVPWNPSDPSDRFSACGQDGALQGCSGFLAAMTSLNHAEKDCYADFFLRPLPPAGSLREALALHFAHEVSENDVVLHDGRPASDWRVHTEEVPFQKAFVARVCADWFFQSEYMQTALRDSYRDGLVDSFLGLLEQGIGACTVHSVSIDPPCWYAIRWDLIAFERGDDRFLLHFSHSN